LALVERHLDDCVTDDQVIVYEIRLFNLIQNLVPYVEKRGDCAVTVCLVCFFARL